MPHNCRNSMKNKHTIRVMIPVGTPDLDSLFPNPRWADEARALYHHLFRIKQIMRTNENFAPGLDRESGYVPVLAEELKEGLNMSNRYNIIRDCLKELGAIEIRPEYMPGMYSMKYRVKFRGLKNKGDQEVQGGDHHPPQSCGQHACVLFKNYEEKRHEFLAQCPWYKPNLELIESMYLHETAMDHALQQGDRADNLIGTIDMFNSRVGRFISQDDFAGRIHHHLGVLDKELRPYLRIESSNEPMIIVDVKSAQPYLLAALLYHPRLIELIPEFRPVLNKITGLHDRPDVRLFFEDCASGTFYDKWIEVTKMGKEKAKKKLFRHVFYSSASNQHRDSKVRLERLRFRNLFEVMYRSVYTILTALKRTQSTTLPFVKEVTSRNGDRGRMYVTPNMMAQRLETSILLNRITKRCNNEGVITATIHDAWILRESDLGKFSQIFNQVFEDLNISPPQLSYERFNTCDNNIEE
jgi:hypothetical protein